MYTKHLLTDFAERFMARSELNQVAKGDALSPEYAGLIMFDMPLTGVASADDPLFKKLRLPEVIGSKVMLPDEWLSGARSVFSFFLPASRRVCADNAAAKEKPSFAWMHMTTEGSLLIKALALALCEYIESMGYRAVAPICDLRTRNYTFAMQDGDRHYISAWSERHTAYIAGIGTFGLSRGLITPRGTAGRFGSVITDMPIEPDPRHYSGLYDYCSFCGKCAKNCPAGAISVELGKRNDICAGYLRNLCAGHEPRNSCGKCQVGVPCEHGIPLPKINQGDGSPGLK